MAYCEGSDRSCYTPITKKELAVACRGSFSEWREACERAKRDGWTEQQVQSILFWHHPSTWVLGVLIALVFGVFVCAATGIIK